MTQAERIAQSGEQQDEWDAVAPEHLTASLRTSYLLQPGATEADFQEALPRLIEEHRQAVATERVRQLRQASPARRSISIPAKRHPDPLVGRGSRCPSEDLSRVARVRGRLGTPPRHRSITENRGYRQGSCDRRCGTTPARHR